MEAMASGQGALAHHPHCLALAPTLPCRSHVPTVHSARTGTCDNHGALPRTALSTNCTSSATGRVLRRGHSQHTLRILTTPLKSAPLTTSLLLKLRKVRQPAKVTQPEGAAPERHSHLQTPSLHALCPLPRDPWGLAWAGWRTFLGTASEMRRQVAAPASNYPISCQEPATPIVHGWAHTTGTSQTEEASKPRKRKCSWKEHPA